MNLKILSNEAMLNTSGFLLEDPKTRRILGRRTLGKAMIEEITEAHDHMLTMRKRRQDIESAIATLSRQITFLDTCYVRKARGFSHLLAACIDSLDDSELMELCVELMKVCFPDGLDMVNLSYLDKAGRARIVQKHIDNDTLARMDAVVVGPKSLGQVFREWIAAGILLGQKTSERARLQSAAQKRGIDADTINVNTVRSLWIRTIRAFLSCVDLMKLSHEDRDAVLSPIAHAVANAERSKKNRAGAKSEDSAGPKDSAGPEDSAEALLPGDHLESSAGPEDSAEALLPGDHLESSAGPEDSAKALLPGGQTT